MAILFSSFTIEPRQYDGDDILYGLVAHTIRAAQVHTVQTVLTGACGKALRAIDLGKANGQPWRVNLDDSAKELQTEAALARVVIVGAAGVADKLTYAIPSSLKGQIQPGHRVLVPLRARRLTGIVLETGENFDSGGAVPLPIAQVLEARPLFDRAHLDLIEFLASYYMVPLSEAYRNVIPATARVESRRLFKAGISPGPFAIAAMTALERSIIEAVAKRPMTLRQLQTLGNRREVEAALGRLLTDGFVERYEGTRGSHRGPAPMVQCAPNVESMRKPRGQLQRAIMKALEDAGGALGQDQIEAVVPNSRSAVRSMVKRGWLQMVSSAICGKSTDPEKRADENSGGDGPELTWEQAAAVRTVGPAIREKRFEPFLLWGVTASGKTEVYLRLAAETLAQGRQVLILVPEIALTDQVVRAFRRRFGALVGVAHSAQNITERWESWMAALNGHARVMIGPRSVVFAPLHEIGLVVVDEEHDGAYKQEEGIRYNARDLAVALARFSNAPVILGSATPSAESYANARRGRYRMLRMTQRVGGRDLAEVAIIDLREHQRRLTEKSRLAAEKDPGAMPALRSKPPDLVPLSDELTSALRDNLAAGGQSVIFLNRRGYHNFLQCHLCGNVIACPNCSVSQTFHLRDRSLRCHYCGFNTAAPERCPECGGHGLEGQGFGTERLVDALRRILPNARIERVDSDTGGRRSARSMIFEALARGQIDVLVGTQMITKGFDFPGVTLVGVVLADMALHMPDFRSAERTFQILTQVAGRAGRGEKPGRVLIQTYAPHHYSIRAAGEQDYTRFMRRELDLRRELMYPPFAHIALVRVEGPDSTAVGEIARAAAALLSRRAHPDRMRVLGPAPAPIERIKRRYRWQVMLKSIGRPEMRSALAAMREEIGARAHRRGVRLALDLDPLNML
jgi:primosomal protein N' (replication factor Y)